MGLLNEFYRPVVDFAQTKGYVVLLGDCIFFFGPDCFETGSPAKDNGLKLAEILFAGFMQINKSYKFEDEINFGVVVHYGQAVVGNLSIDKMIDHTCLGQVVNQATRMEEMRKFLLSKNLIEKNILLVSKEAYENLGV